MNRRYAILALLIPPLAVLLIPAWAPAQSPAPADQAGGKKWMLAFRMQSWHKQHLHDPAQAAKQVETLKTLGCEVKQAQHDGHIDVEYRTVFWKLLALDNNEQLQQWQAWLRQANFDTLHGLPAAGAATHNADGSHRELVQFRLADWRAQHIHQSHEVGQLTTLYVAMGCEVEKEAHDGHTDLRVRCPDWRVIELPTHDAAHKWQDFLNTAGFETKHEH